MKKNNRIVVDLGKVQYAEFYYSNGKGNKRTVMPRLQGWFSVNGTSYNRAEKVFPHPTYPNESIYDCATRLGVLDKWVPICKLQLQANHSLVYVGSKARSIWKEWNRRQFNKKK